MVQATTTYLRDTKDLLGQIKDLAFDPNTSFLVSLDIESLYTSLPQDDTLKVLETSLDSVTWKHKTPKSFILKCAVLALNENYFEFEGQLYLQTYGTSMGSTFAPSVAGLYVFNFEQTHLFNPNTPSLMNIWFYKRYIDYVFLIWEGSEESPRTFFDWINGCDPTLQTEDLSHS